jgi:hypothetical protein
MNDLAIFRSLDEQTSVRFTGRVNVMERLTRQLLGVVTLKDGEVFGCRFRGEPGLKAFHALVWEDAQLVPLDFVVEPEIVADEDRQIHYPYAVLKQRALAAAERYRQVANQRPPGHVKLIVRAGFLASELPVSAAEFHVMASLCDWSVVDELYAQCSLLPHEITEALVSLRKKNALEVIGTRSA